MRIRVVALAVVLALIISGCKSLPSESDTSSSTQRGDMTFAELTQTPGYQSLVEDSCWSSFTGTIQNLDFLELGVGQIVSSKSQVMISRTERLEKSLKNDTALTSILQEALSWRLSADDSSWITPSKALDEYLLTQLEKTLLPPLLQGEYPKNQDVLNQISEDWIKTCEMDLVVSQAREVSKNYEGKLTAAIDTFKKPLLDDGYQDFGMALAKLKISGSTAIVQWASTDWCTPVASVVVLGIPDADGISSPGATARLLLQHPSEFEKITSNFDLRKELNRGDLSSFDVKNGVLASVECS